MLLPLPLHMLVFNCIVLYCIVYGLTCTLRASCCSTHLTYERELVVGLLVISQREQGIMALHLPFEFSKTTTYQRHDIAEILLELALNTNQSINQLPTSLLPDGLATARPRTMSSITERIQFLPCPHALRVRACLLWAQNLVSQ